MPSSLLTTSSPSHSVPWSQSELTDNGEPCRTTKVPLPPLTHTLHQQETSVLSLAADERWIYSGSQGMHIYVWDRETFKVNKQLHGHTGSVLCLEVSVAKNWLFSSSGDSTVRVWSTETLTPIYILHPFDYNSGDIFSLTFSASIGTLFFGCQNTSLQWFDFSPESEDIASCVHSQDPDHPPANGHSRTPSVRKPHKFFDSEPQPFGRPSTRSTSSLRGSVRPSPVMTPMSTETTLPTTDDGLRAVTVPPTNWVSSAHYGYIYCISLVREYNDEKAGRQRSTMERVGRERKRTALQLVTGSGDEDVKLWAYEPDATPGQRMQLVHTFHSNVGGVLSILSAHGNIYAGCQSGHVKIWDIDTKTLVRTLIAHEGIDILCISLAGQELYVGSANGGIRRYSPSFDCTGCWKAHAGALLSSILVPSRRLRRRQQREWDHYLTEEGPVMELVTGASDNNIKIWAVQTSPNLRRGRTAALSNGHVSTPSFDRESLDDADRIESNDTLIHALSEFVSFPSISNHAGHSEDCRQAAKWLKSHLTQLGAEAQLLYGVEGHNPVVLGRFRGTESDKPKRRMLFYGHYDVIDPGSEVGWNTDPFTVTGLNGYLYGRGVTDNKGPTLAVACAASELLGRRALDVDLVMLIEGEEEAGSAGFAEAVKKHKDQIGHIDGILVSNSYWIDDDRPCITYGLRGVVHAVIDVFGEGPDVHSGVDGGAAVEPMVDMIHVLSHLSRGARVAIPGFYDQVRVESEEESDTFKVLANITGRTAQSFSARWREPSLSVHSITDSGAGNPTVIPGRVRAKVSLRIVPDQDPPTIVRSLETCIHTLFDDLDSPNTLKIHIDRAADWWIGKLEHPWFRALEGAIADEWGVTPLRIREGGSIPSVPWLEKEFACPAFHLPMGQSSDQAHLLNERMSLTNLNKGKAVISRFLERIATININGQ